MKTEMRKTQFKFIVNGYSMVDFNPIANPLPPKYKTFGTKSSSTMLAFQIGFLSDFGLLNSHKSQHRLTQMLLERETK